MWLLLGLGGGGGLRAGKAPFRRGAGKAPFRWGKTRTRGHSAVPPSLCGSAAAARGLAPLSAPLRGSPAPRPCPRGPSTGPGARRPRAGGTEGSVKA